MSDLSRLKALYEKIGVVFPSEEGEIEEKTDGTTSLTIGVYDGKSNIKGYAGFFTDLEFDKDGNFIKQGIWE